MEERPTIKENSKSNVVLQVENVGGLVHENVIDVLTPSKYLFSSGPDESVAGDHARD